MIYIPYIVYQKVCDKNLTDVYKLKSSISLQVFVFRLKICVFIPMLNFEDKNKCKQIYLSDAAFSEIFQLIFICLDKNDATMHNMIVRSSFLFYLGGI
jgi:hypothetical protein